VIDLIGAFPNAELPIRVTDSVLASEGKKTDEGTMMFSSQHKSNPATVAESPETRTLTPATTKEASDILINCRKKF
jgi:hypothetical protein